MNALTCVDSLPYAYFGSGGSDAIQSTIFIGVDSVDIGDTYNGQIIEETLHNLFPNTDEHKSMKFVVTMMSVAAAAEEGSGLC